jgi:hypothetical protein
MYRILREIYFSPRAFDRHCQLYWIGTFTCMRRWKLLDRVGRLGTGKIFSGSMFFPADSRDVEHFCLSRLQFSYTSISLAHPYRFARTELLLARQPWRQLPLPRSPSWTKRILFTLLTTLGATQDIFPHSTTELSDVVTKYTVRSVLLATRSSTFDSVSWSVSPTPPKK